MWEEQWNTISQPLYESIAAIIKLIIVFDFN